MRSTSVIMALGVGLFLIAVVHHMSEISALNMTSGPTLALVLDGLPALALGYGGYQVSQTEFTPADRLQVLVWTLGGCLAFSTVIAITFFVRSIEGRVIAEPLFPLLIAAEAGAIAGLFAGYYSTQAQAEARHARTVTDAHTFVNTLIRHDLRNDLNVIQGHAELIETQQLATDDESEHDSAAVIAEKAGEALTRIQTTRAIMDSLVGDPELEPVDVTMITADLATQFEATYDVTVTTDLPERALVAANAGLRSVVDNLLENTIEHNDTDDPHVVAAVETDAETVRITVSDNGPGISENEKQVLINTNRTEADENGFALVQRLVEVYDGTIRVEDNEPRGSRFIVELPPADRPS